MIFILLSFLFLIFFFLSFSRLFYFSCFSFLIFFPPCFSLIHFYCSLHIIFIRFLSFLSSLSLFKSQFDSIVSLYLLIVVYMCSRGSLLFIVYFRSVTFQNFMLIEWTQINVIPVGVSDWKSTKVSLPTLSGTWLILNTECLAVLYWP